MIKIMFQKSLPIAISIFLLGCESGSFTGTVTLDPNSPGLTTGTTTAVSTIPFGGAELVGNATGTSLQVSWTMATGSVLSYSIYDISTGTPLFVGTAASTASNYTVTGLTPGTTYRYRVRLNDTSGLQDDNTQIVSGQTVGVYPPSNLTYSTNPASYNAEAGITSNTPTVSGGAVASYTVSPSLPTGLTLDSTTGIISGTPTALSSLTNYTITATNAGGSSSVTLPIVVQFAGASSISGATSSALIVNWTGISDAATYSIYNVTSGTRIFVGSVNAPAIHYTVTGLSASTAYQFRVRATSGTTVSDTNTTSASGTTLSGGTTPPSSLAYGTPTAIYTVGTAISTNSPSNGGTAITSYSVSPALPTGLALSSTTGLITGTPLVLSSSANYTVTGTNANGSTATSVNITVNFAGLTSVTGATGSTLTLNWTGISDAASYSVYEVVSGSLLFRRNVTAPASSTTISSLTSNTTHTYRVRATNSLGDTDSNTVNQSGTTLNIVPPNTLVYSTPTATYTAGTAITTNTPSNGGGAPTSYAISPVLPTGLSFNTSTGAITGTPSILHSASDFTITTTNGGGSTTGTVNLAVNFSGLTSVNGATGTTLTLNWTHHANATAYSVYSVVSGTPTFVTSLAAATATYTATGLGIGTAYTYRVRATNALGVTDANTTDVSGTTLGTTPPGGLTYSTNPATYVVGTAITTNSPTLATGASTSYSVSPAFPAGLTLNTTTGAITGTPTALANQASYTVTATNAGGSTTVSIPITVNFSGLSSLSNVAFTTMQLNWTSLASASNYLVYNMTSGSPVFVASVTAPATSYTATGLTISTAYTFRVRSVNTSGVTDTNTMDVSATTLSETATHTGWSDIKATGTKTPATQSGLSSAAASVTLGWNASTISSGSAASYNIYRATTSGGQNFASPLATGITTSARSYTDATVTSGTTYYYTIAAVVGGVASPVTTSDDSEVKVIVPPANMSLVHRWAANQEMCGLMSRSVDRTNHYRCAYVGPGGTGSYFDIAASFFVDTNELGCNYTPAPGCSDATNGCLGTSDPASGTGSVGNVFYNRGNGNCWVKTASNTWTSANTAGISAANRLLMASNKPGLPPLVNLDQNRAYDSCQAQSKSGFSGNKKLLTHQQQIIAASWPSTQSDTTITNTENGTALPSSGYCNSNTGSGLTYDNNATPSFLETLPGTNASGIRSVRTGGTSTANCVSRYGIQDFVGNVWEWSSDQLATCSSGSHTCTGQTSSLDSSNTAWGTFNFSGSIGPGGGGSNLTEWDFGAMSFSASQFNIPLGLPMVAAAASSYDYHAIGTGAGQFDPAKFHADHFWLYTDYANGTPARGAIAGGSWRDGSRSGRFALHLYLLPASVYSYVGARCALPAE